MGRNKDHKARRSNAVGIARNRQRDTATKAAIDATENECPKCGAKPGEVCVTPSGKPAAKTHVDRLK